MFSAAKLVDSSICELGVGERCEKPDADIPAATYLVNRLCVAFGWVIAVSVFLHRSWLSCSSPVQLELAIVDAMFSSFDGAAGHRTDNGKEYPRRCVEAPSPAITASG
jgi:hypothetical protein